MIAQNDYTLIKASPGSGKTTRIPAEMLKISAKKILVLEPRKIAAKLQAQRISDELNIETGKLVGYIFKGEQVVTQSTKLLFITEGTLLRFLENDPLLKAYEYIFLDEFHERHLETDLAFYHLQKINQKRLKDNLPRIKIIFMSATLNTDLLREKLGALEEFNIELPPNPLSVNYLPNTPSVLNERLPIKIKNALKSPTEHPVSGVLIFVPGKKEINDVIDSLSQDQEFTAIYEITALHGELSKNEQQLALSPTNGERKKIVVATNIAESSITIPFINVVIDSGLERENVGNVITGFGKLVTKKISRASAEQRAGRANRTGPGTVFRLYSKLDYDQREKFKKPSLLRAPLMEPLISILKNHQELEKDVFLESPPIFHIEKGIQQLKFLNIIDENSKLSPKGIALNPSLDFRLSLIVQAYQFTKDITEKEVCSYLNDYLDFETKIDFEKALTKVKKSSSDIKLIADIDELILQGFIDLLGYISTDKKIILQNGESFYLSKDFFDKYGKLPEETLCIVTSMNANEEINGIITVEKKSLESFSAISQTETQIIKNPNGKNKIITKKKIGVITLEEKSHFEDQSQDDKSEVIKNEIDKLTTDFFNDPDFIRISFFAKFFGKNNIEDFETSILKEVYVLEWSELEQIETFHKTEFIRELKNELLGFLNPEYALKFEDIFPPSMRFSDRRETKLHYEIHGEEHLVFVESYMQDFYGLNNGPSIAEGKIQLTFRLLGPHKRALQVTKDLTSFWSKTYKEMYNELNRDYPRHYWPTNPESAKPFLLKRMINP